MAITHGNPGLEQAPPFIPGAPEAAPYLPPGGRGRRAGLIGGVAALALAVGVSGGAWLGMRDSSEPVVAGDPVPTTSGPAPTPETTIAPIETTPAGPEEAVPFDEIVFGDLPEDAYSKDIVLNLSEAEQAKREAARRAHEASGDDFAHAFKLDFKNAISGGKPVPVLFGACAGIDINLRNQATGDELSYFMVLPNPLNATTENSHGGLESAYVVTYGSEEGELTVFTSTTNSTGEVTYVSDRVAPEEFTVTTDRPANNQQNVTIVGPMLDIGEVDGLTWRDSGFLADTANGQQVVVGGVATVRNYGDLDRAAFCDQALSYTHRSL